MRHYRLVFLLPLWLVACKTSQVSTSATDNVYSEDLSYLRPDLQVEVNKEDDKSTPALPIENSLQNYSWSIKDELDSVNQIIAQRNKQAKYIDGYTVQIYAGNDRNAADEARDLALELDSTLNPVKTYYPPTHKVKVGQYTTRLEAHKAYEDLKIHFPRALMVPERIKIVYE